MFFRVKKSAVKIFNNNRLTTQLAEIRQVEVYDFIKKTFHLEVSDWFRVAKKHVIAKSKSYRKRAKVPSSRWKIVEPLRARSLYRMHYLQMRNRVEVSIRGRRVGRQRNTLD
jgi:hypothetical protein